MAGRHIFITGASGSGKTTLVHGLHERYPDTFSAIPSIITRAPRADDEPHIIHISKENFVSMEGRGELIWKRENHGNFYGTRIADLETAIGSGHDYLNIVSPECIPILASFASERKIDENRFIFIHIYTPHESTLRERLTLRGDAPDAIEQRLADCREWDSYTRSLNLPIHFLENNGEPHELIEQATKIIPIQ